ncbi:hypothetical protein IW137_004463, partial [Coemansia sp. RSA 1287]
MTDGVSISVVRETKDEPDETKDEPGETNTKRKRVEPQQLQQEQPAAQRARLSFQPSLQPSLQPSYQPSYQLSYQPSYQPSFQPSYQPLLQSLYQSLYQPSYQPGVLPQLPPSFQQAPPPVQLEQQPWMQVVQQALLQYPQAPPSFQQLPTQQGQPLAKNTKKRRPAKPQQKTDCQYIDELSQAQLQNMAGRCVLIDPGRRDLLFAMHEDSTVEDKQLYRYTRNQQRKETRVTRFKRILEKVKKADAEDIAEAERSLGAGSCVKPDLELFKEYLVARAQVADKLTRFYNETYTVHPTSTHKIHKDKPKAEVRAYPLHRKLRLSAYVNQKQADQRLINKLRKEFGPNAVIIIGDWSAPMNRFHEPIRGKSWRTLLKRGGFEVYLIKEYLT